MTTFRQIVVAVACVAVICGAAILWPVYKKKATERKLAEAATVHARQGDANAQYSLGNMYRKGQGVPQDHAQAVRWFREAAGQGDTKAQFNLAFMYAHGQGVPQDYAEAVHWARQAAEQGYAKAQYILGVSYGRGNGVPQDYTEAVRWYRKAADQGDAYGQYGLGFSYAQGNGVPQDYTEAVRWYRKAADQGDVNAQYALGFMSGKGQGVPQDYAEAVRWYTKAARQGDAQAQIVLGKMYRNGQGVPQSYAQAALWFGKAAASSFARCLGGPLSRGTFIAVILLALPLLAVPPRRWRRATWLPLALLSAFFAVGLAHELLRPSFSLALLARELSGIIFRGFGRVLWFSLLAGGSALCAIGAVLEVVRGSKRGDQGQPSTPPGGTLESPT
jgi:TPR repeat protein